MAEINLLSAEIAHAIDIERMGSGLGSLSNSHIKNIAEFIKQVLLEDEFITTKKRRDELIKLISDRMGVELGQFTDEMTKDLNDIISEEIDFNASLLETVTDESISKPSLKEAIKTFESAPLVLSGSAFAVNDYIKSYAPSQIDKVKKIIIGGWSDGSTTREIQRQITGTDSIKGALSTSQRSAYMLAKDLVSHQSSVVKSEIAKENEDVIIGEKVIVTLDSKTSPICQKLGSQDNGGKEFIYSKVGRKFKRSPFHQFCRSTMTFVLSKEFAELEAGRTRPAVINGKAVQVDAKTNWLDIAKSNKGFAEVSLGKSKAEILQSMSATEFSKAAYNRLNEPITIKQMKKSSNKIKKLLE